MKISIFSLFRDSEPHLSRCLDQLKEVESSTDVDFSYFFYENDSTDDTEKILRSWGKSRSFNLSCEKLNAPKYGSTLDPQRMILMSDIRNRMKNLDAEFDSDYSVIFDSDVSFDSNIINDFLNCKDLDFSMLTSNIRQNVPCKMGSNSEDSYYDSSILFDMDGTQCMTWSDNPFYRDGDIKLFNESKPVKVKRAFGSFAFLKSKAFKECEWKSQGESEHWSFCDRLRSIAPIYLIPSIRPFVEVSQKKWDHESEVVKKQKWLLESKWNRFLWKTGSIRI